MPYKDPEKHRECCKRSQKTYYEKNKPKVLEWMKSYRVRTRPKHNAYAQKWRAKNAEKQRAANRRFYKKHRELCLERNKEYRKNNPRWLLIRRLECRTMEWIRNAMRREVKLKVTDAVDYLEWQASERGLDLSKYHIHHLRACVNYSPVNPSHFYEMHHPSNLWFITALENMSLHDGESPTSMLQEAKEFYEKYLTTKTVESEQAA